MSRHTYTPEAALDLLMGKLRGSNESLAANIQAAINSGKDTSEEEPERDRRKRSRVYRRTVPFTHEEALQVALDALQAYFVEQPLFINDAEDTFAKAAIGKSPREQGRWIPNGEEREPVTVEQEGDEKSLEIELQTETQISRVGDETFVLKRTSPELIEEQKRHISQLRSLTNFSEE